MSLNVLDMFPTGLWHGCSPVTANIDPAPHQGCWPLTVSAASSIPTRVLTGLLVLPPGLQQGADLYYRYNPLDLLRGVNPYCRYNPQDPIRVLTLDCLYKTLDSNRLLTHTADTTP